MVKSVEADYDKWLEELSVALDTFHRAKQFVCLIVGQSKESQKLSSIRWSFFIGLLSYRLGSAYTTSQLRCPYTFINIYGVMSTGLKVKGTTPRGGCDAGFADANVLMPALPKPSTSPSKGPPSCSKKARR